MSDAKIKIDPNKMFLKETQAIALMQRGTMDGISPSADRLDRLVNIIQSLQAEKEKLVEALTEAVDSFEYYTQYAGDTVDKHGVADEVARYKALLKELEESGEY